MDNLTAWAMTQGYDPTEDYTTPDGETLPDGYISKHFRQAEFTCNHCGEIHPTYPTPPTEVLEWLEIVRAHYDSPVIVNSGYRCSIHNKNVGGATSSLHLQGQAVDFRVVGVDPAKVYSFCDALIKDAGGVGKYQSFTHIDNRGYKARW